MLSASSTIRAIYIDKEDLEKEILERAYRRAREYADLEPDLAKRLDVER